MPSSVPKSVRLRWPIPTTSILLFLLVSSGKSCGVSATDEKAESFTESRVREAAKPTKTAEIVEALREDLPAGWSVKSDHRSIVISRDEQVTLLNRISLPAMMPGDDLLREHGFKSDYLIVLVFRPRMTDQQFLEMKAKQDEACSKIADDPELNGKKKYGRLARERNRYLLPTYFNYRFSIYLHRTDGPPLEVYPESAAANRTKILNALSSLMERYEDQDN